MIEEHSVGVDPIEDIRIHCSGGGIDGEDLMAEPDGIPPPPDTPVDQTQGHPQFAGPDTKQYSPVVLTAMGKGSVLVTFLKGRKLRAGFLRVMHDYARRAVIRREAFGIKVQAYLVRPITIETLNHAPTIGLESLQAARCNDGETPA
jgi:hypothetical protein